MAQRFVKYHGLGNDFVVVDLRAGGADFTPERSREWCDRRRGIGADGVLTILPEPGTDGRMVVHNADGSVAEMCGNGIRCVVKHLAEASGEKPSSLLIATGAGRLKNEIQWVGDRVHTVTVEMGPATLGATDVELQGVRGSQVSMGNPHFVISDAPIARARELGALLESDPFFPQRTNVEFCQYLRSGGLEVVVFERGVGLTEACGTGACAAVVAYAMKGRVQFDLWVPVQLPGGMLEIKARKDLSQVLLRGTATQVFEGER